MGGKLQVASSTWSSECSGQDVRPVAIGLWLSSTSRSLEGERIEGSESRPEREDWPSIVSQSCLEVVEVGGARWGAGGWDGMGWGRGGVGWNGMRWGRVESEVVVG